jgi:hypothetical protein
LYNAKSDVDFHFTFSEPTWFQQIAERVSKGEDLIQLRKYLMNYRDYLVKQTETLFHFVQKQKEQLFLLKNERDRVMNLMVQFNSNNIIVNMKDIEGKIQTLVHKCIQFYKDNRDHVNRVFLF